MTTYSAVGVDLDEADRFTEWVSTRGGGLFGGMVPVDRIRAYTNPVLITSIDGIGSKASLARHLGRLQGLGKDIVHHCVNDIAVHGAEPILFMDYLAFHHLDAEQASAIVTSIEGACSALGITLAGGETAELPSLYRAGEFEIAGAIVGVAERCDIVDGSAMKSGDTVLALRSSGLHTNGFTLAQSLFSDSDYSSTLPGSNVTLGEALLEPHRCYLDKIRSLIACGGVRGFAHITGGGLRANLSRIVPDNLQATIDPVPWPILFTVMAERGVDRVEMERVFNLGIGLVAVCDPAVRDRVGAEWERIGEVRASDSERKVVYSDDGR